jgi:hypothetical protein
MTTPAKSRPAADTTAADAAAKEPLTLAPMRVYPARRIDPGFWLKGRYTDQDLIDALDVLVRENAKRMGIVQQALDRELPIEDPHGLAEAMNWLDAQLAFVGTLKSQADALLDIACQHFLPVPGRSEMCTDDQGRPIADSKSPTKDPTADNFIPKWQALTDNDRRTYCNARSAPFRLLRDEYVVLQESLTGRLIRTSSIMGELRARHRAAGASERHM